MKFTKAEIKKYRGENKKKVIFYLKNGTSVARIKKWMFTDELINECLAEIY